MRELKFRVWDGEKFLRSSFGKQDKEFISLKIEGGILPQYGGRMNYHMDMIVQQYTGLKDRNGKEIYEGDILYRSQADSYWKVEYQAEEAAFILLDRYNETWGFLALRHNSEIVGNIFENPELLK